MKQRTDFALQQVELTDASKHGGTRSPSPLHISTRRRTPARPLTPAVGGVAPRGAAVRAERVVVGTALRLTGVVHFHHSPLVTININIPNREIQRLVISG